jgi:hypothetical protein
LTRVKVISVLAVALVLTAFGATAAFAWQSTLTATADCDFVTVTGHDKANDTSDQTFRANPEGKLIFVQAGGTPKTVPYTFDKDNPSNDQVIAKVDVSDLKPGQWVISVKGVPDLKTVVRVPSDCASPSPTATAQPTETPSESPSPSATASPEATASASPSASAEASSSAVPSPPVTGAGSGSGGDGTFGIVLLVMVLGTVGIGGTTLFLSRKGS